MQSMMSDESKAVSREDVAAKRLAALGLGGSSDSTSKVVAGGVPTGDSSALTELQVLFNCLA
jgi:hypothetical protein